MSFQMLAHSPESNATHREHPDHKKIDFHPESQYLDLLKLIIGQGERRSDRTGTGTLSLFAPPQLRFPLDRFPLLTTKKVFLRPVFEELMWFMRGQTDAKILSAKNVKIWDLNGSRDALDAAGLLHREEGDLGPVYGFQWRHFGARYMDCKTDYTGQGADQLRSVIEMILYNPTSRRIVLSAWNPLGVPFNIASYSLMTLMLAHLCNLECGEFIHCMGDAHVYLDHVDALNVQVQRRPKPFPRIRLEVDRINADGLTKEQHVDLVLNALTSIEFNQVHLVDYDPHPKIAMQMSV